VDLNWLRVLVAFADRGTVRAAATATGYTASAVSGQLAGLQRDIGVPLFERDGRRLRLTAAGSHLVTRARRILADVEETRLQLSGGGAVAGTVRVAAYATLLATDVVPIAAQLADAHPDVRVELQEREPEEVTLLLRDNRVDVGFVYDYSLVPRWRPDRDTRYLCCDPMLLAVPAASPLTQKDSTLEHAAWVVNSRGADDGELARRACALQGFVPDIRHYADSLDIMTAMVAAGLGVALVPALVSPHPGVVLRPYPGPPLRRRAYALTRPGRRLWPPATLIVDAVARRVA